MWRSRLLSHVGKLQLIKSVINRLPLYFLSLFKMADNVSKKIISIQRRSFWNGNSEGGKLNSVAWNDMQIPKCMGGLGFGSFKLKNLGLLLKWWWRYS